MIVIGYMWKDGVITSSREARIPCQNVTDILDEFLEPYKLEGQQTWKVAYDIDDLIIPLLRLLPLEILKTLAEKEAAEFATTGSDGEPRKYRLWYPRQDGIGQAFAITDKSNPKVRFEDRNEVVIWHLGSFMPDGMESPRDALDVELYARKIMDIFAKLLRFTPVPGNFYSPVNVVKPYIKGMGLPKVTDLPPMVANFASKTMAPPWQEAHQLGYWQRATDVDLSNAYAGILKGLPDWRMGEWGRSKDWQDKASLGYCRCNITIRPEVTLHPIMTELPDSKEGLTVCATGTQHDVYLTKRQIEFVRQWKLGEVEILDGVWWIPDPKHSSKPMQVIIDRLTTQREAMAVELKETDQLLGRFLAKKVMVGLWGYTARWDWEKDKAPDEFYNPAWAAEITTRIPLRVASFIYRKKLMDKVICTAVDGFNMDASVDITSEDQEAGWKISELGPALCMSSHHSWMGKRKPEAMYLGDIMGAIKANPESDFWLRKATRRATLGDCMTRGNYGLLGKPLEIQGTVYLRREHSRIFRPEPKTGAALLRRHYRSKPIHFTDGAG